MKPNHIQLVSFHKSEGSQLLHFHDFSFSHHKPLLSGNQKFLLEK